MIYYAATASAHRSAVARSVRAARVRQSAAAARRRTTPGMSRGVSRNTSTATDPSAPL